MCDLSIKQTCSLVANELIEKANLKKSQKLQKEGE